jgi:hypothetical protein
MSLEYCTVRTLVKGKTKEKKGGKKGGKKWIPANDASRTGMKDDET